MAKRYAVLIDGAFAFQRFKGAGKQYNAASVEQFVMDLGALPELAGHSLHRVYYYNASPYTGKKPKPLGGLQVDFSTTPASKASEKFHNELREKPFFALRLGEAAFRGWRLSDTVLTNATTAGHTSVTVTEGDLEANIQQKGVDMRIGLDIASLTLKDHVDIIVLVAGDSDFVPAMKFARREGAQLFLVALGHSIMVTMKEHSDIRLTVPGYPA